MAPKVAKGKNTESKTKLYSHTSPPWGTPKKERMPHAHVEIIRMVRRGSKDHENDDDDNFWSQGAPICDVRTQGGGEGTQNSRKT